MQEELKSAINKIADRQNDISTFSFEINLTDACNYNCTYCFEKNMQGRVNILSEHSDIIVKRIKELLNDKWFNVVFRGIKIDFWGGEPTLNIPLMKKIIEPFQYDERVKFFLYTNGSRIAHVIPIAKEFKGKRYLGKDINRFDIQVSYDGNPIHDMCRISSTGQTTSGIALEAMRHLKQNKIPFEIKSTVTQDTFKYMSDAWSDIRYIHDNVSKSVRYAPTIDYFGDIKFDMYKDDLEEALIDIASKELNFIRINKYPLFAWFDGQKRNCGSGKNMCSLDVNGDLHICHGCVYSQYKDDFKFGTIFDDGFIERLQHNFGFFRTEIDIPECEDCEATICLRCPVVKYAHSNKEDFRDRFYDYLSQEGLCKYYKLVGKITRALKICAHGGI